MTRFLWFIGGFLLALAVLLLLALFLLQHDGALALLRPTTLPESAAAATPATLLPEAAPTLQPAQDGDYVLRWVRQSTASEACSRLEVDSAQQARYGPCDEGSRLAQLTQAELDLLLYYLLRYRPFDLLAQQDAGSVSASTLALDVRGTGRLTASPQNQAEIARWAEQVYDRLSEAEHRGDLVARCRSQLAARLGLPIEQVLPLAFDAVRWPDACLGLRESGVFCAHVITPGYRIILMAGDTSYEYRADAYGQLRTTEGIAPGYLLAPLDN